MGGTRLSSTGAALLLVLCGCLAPAAANLNMSAVCLLVSNGVYVGSDTDCSSYYLCQGSLATLQTCGNGQSFDKNSQQCVPSSMSNCITSGVSNSDSASSTPCLGKTPGSFQSASGSCSDYYYCGASGAQRGSCPDGQNFNPTLSSCVYASNYPCAVNNANNLGCSGKAVGSFQGVSGSCTDYYYCSATGPLRGSCPAGENFNPVTASCVYASNYPCSTDGVTVGLNLCSLIEDNMYFGSPQDCTAWNYCQNNVLLSGNCQNNMDYNVAKGLCDYPQSTICSQVTNDPTLVGSLVGGGSCSALGSRKNATACNQYYQCSSTSTYTLETCPPTYYYDTPSQLCVPRMSARNNCDRCVGTTKTFVNAYSDTSCQDYLYCLNGVEQAQESCPLGYYFNEVSGNCAPGLEPQFLCCNPSGSSGTTSSTTIGTTTSASDATGSTTTGSTTTSAGSSTTTTTTTSTSTTTDATTSTTA